MGFAPLFLIGLLGLVSAGFLSYRILSNEEGTKKMVAISRAIQEGAMAFLYYQYSILAIFIVILAPILWLTLDDPASTFPHVGKYTALAFVLGAICSGATGYAGLNIAVRANVRTANAAVTGLRNALKIAFSSGAVMGLSVVSWLFWGSPSCTI